MDKRAAVWAAASGALVGVAAYLVLHPSSPADLYARAIEAGEMRSHVLIPDDAEDDAITTDANEAGYRWAERNAIARPGDCPTSPLAYREGCLAYVSEVDHAP